MTPEEDAAFAEYFTARRDRVRRTAYLLCSDWHKADDLTQMAFVKLYGAWNRIRDARALDSYVRSCLVRTTIDESRKGWRREKPTEFLPESVDLDAADIAAMVANKELVQKALLQVPLGQRTALVLRYFEGMDVSATARAMKCSEGNVKSQTSRGLAALKAAIQAKEVRDDG